MDENTRMMMQFASLMMQNAQQQQMQQQNQQQMQMMQGLQAQPNFQEMMRQMMGNPECQKNNFGHNPNQVFLAELARQMLMNAGGGMVMPNMAAGQQPMMNEISSPSDKQKVGVQESEQGATASNQIGNSGNSQNQTSEGRIFVYQQMPNSANSPNYADHKDSSPPPMASNNHVTESTHAPTRFPPQEASSKPLSPRLLRPGIDNFGRLSSVANPRLIMHAMQIMKRKDKKKRGPKEKETFPVFMYCLPDKNAKLPKFSSLDPVERNLVEQHQQQGYGYPAQDYINGIPRKTQMCLSFSPEKFHNFMTAIYPKLEGRFFAMYRIDKTRRLIKIDVKCPRELKDMKYQGSVIVIPYDDIDDPPAPVIHRNFDDCFITSASAQFAMMQNLSIPPGAFPGPLDDSLDVQKEYPQDQPVFPGRPKSMTLPTAMPVERNQESNGASESFSNGSLEEGPSDLQMSADDDSYMEDSSIFENIKLLDLAREQQQNLKENITISIRPERLFEDIIQTYTKHESLEAHRLTMHFKSQAFGQNTSMDNEEVDPGSVLVKFWEEALRTLFHGDQEQCPKLDPRISEDLYIILGRILVHGVLLANYWPIKFATACAASILVKGKLSDKLLWSSLYSVMSESEKEVLEAAMNEVKTGSSELSPSLNTNLKLILGSYGCREMPHLQKLDASMSRIARHYLIHQVYWPLEKIKEGFMIHGKDLTEDIQEEDVIQFYQILSPTVPALIERITYIFSSDPDTSESENQVKQYFEQYLFKLTKPKLLKLLFQWCGYDCLCMSDLYVKFQRLQDVQVPVFSPKLATLSLPSACISFEELAKVIEKQLPSLESLDL